MLSVSDLFYNDKEQPVMVLGSDRGRSQRKGYLSRQDSRNFRSSASPPPSRSNTHASSWFGHRKSSSSPPRSRHHAYESEYSDYRRSKHGGRSPERRSWFGRSSRDSLSPPSSYHDNQSHTKYKEDYTGYAQETGYSADKGYSPGTGYRTHHDRAQSYAGYSSGSGYATGHHYSNSLPYTSGEIYHGQHTATIPRTYQTAYGATNFYSKDHAEAIKLKVPLCCEACEERITNHMLALEGVESVTCDQGKQKVTVVGVASPSEVLRQGRECFKQTRFW